MIEQGIARDRCGRAEPGQAAVPVGFLAVGMVLQSALDPPATIGSSQPRRALICCCTACSTKAMDDRRKTMKVLLTGAFGNIGLQTLRELLAHGHTVRCFDVRDSRRTSGGPSR